MKTCSVQTSLWQRDNGVLLKTCLWFKYSHAITSLPQTHHLVSHYSVEVHEDHLILLVIDKLCSNCSIPWCPVIKRVKLSQRAHVFHLLAFLDNGLTICNELFRGKYALSFSTIGYVSSQRPIETIYYETTEEMVLFLFCVVMRVYSCK